ncbi:VOC family protein [Stenotrophomonas sp. HITSZ_GD]|uniref:VOC family protein n=1 Tax=Stenotrophomonas sp. HITSZ_GD TaxID=3037248 RepID=UPI00240E85B3|nr:VOC family protein [Stenotrophomonas sp. HITSZ_GD]MDG2526406.1 VOC family protein [Stenotrophomonas sp. HITSZ_GD]
MELLVNLDVPDLPAAQRLYTAAFGLRPGRRFGDAALEMRGAAVPLYLLAQPDGSPGAGGQPRDYARHWTPVHLDVVVEDLDAALERALAAGLEADDLPDRRRDPAAARACIRQAPWGRLLRLADPFGHGWCLIQFSAAGYDAVATSGPDGD